MAFQVLSVQSWLTPILGSQLPFLHTWNSHPAFVTSDAEQLGLCSLLMHLPDHDLQKRCRMIDKRNFDPPVSMSFRSHDLP